jgi:GTPase
VSETRPDPGTHPGYRSGFVALIGRPNVGKSTLLNHILGEKIAIISDKPQTTRTRILGVKHLPDAQLIVLDTPGIHKPQYRLNQRMVRVALETLEEVDLILFLIEATEKPGAGDRYVLEQLKSRQTPVMLVINKIDIVQKSKLLPLIDAYQHLHNFTEIVPVSALTGEGVDRLVDLSVQAMPMGPAYFKEDVVTDQPMQLLAAELIREKILSKTRDELPFAVAVQIESFVEEKTRGRKGEEELARIAAIVYVEKQSQKGIVIGKGGQLLKAVGTEARMDMERLFGMKVFLDLWVKVKQGWRQDEHMLESLGY